MSNNQNITCNGQDGFIAKFNQGSGATTFAVKDTLDVEGVPTMSGCKAFALAPAARSTAKVVTQLLRAGFSLKGKTALHELAFGVTGVNHWSGTPINPGYPELIPGGSSSGSAAVVAGELVDFSVGTDTGGSVRMPAACCGVIGLKPTFGAVSREGVHPQTSSLDCVGFFTRDISTLRNVLSAIELPSGNGQIENALPVYLAGHASSQIDAFLQDVLARSALPLRQASLALMADAHLAGIKIISHENWNAFGKLVDHPDVSADVKSRIIQGGKVTNTEIESAENIRRTFSDELDNLLQQHQFIMLPALPELPPTLKEAEDPLTVVSLTRLLRPFNLSGHPAITIPAGEIAGRPVSLQIVAAKGNETGLLNMAEVVLAAI